MRRRTKIEREVDRARKEAEEKREREIQHQAKLQILYERLAKNDTTLTLGDGLLILQDQVERFNEIQQRMYELGEQ